MYTIMCMYRERKRETRNSGRESKTQSFRWSLRVNKHETREDIEGNAFHWLKKNHSKRIFLTASHSRTCGHTSWDRLAPPCTHIWDVNVFLFITLPAVENKRSGSVEVAGIASTRLANTPNQGKRCTAPQRHSSRGFLSVGKGTVRVFHVLISLSAISALERSKKFLVAAAEAVTKKSLTSSIELLTSVDASEFLTSSITAKTIMRMSAQPWSGWSGLIRRSGMFWGSRSVAATCS